MKSLTKEMFTLLIRIKPQILIGKEIIYQEKVKKILDISVSGDFMLLESISTTRSWELVDGVGDTVILDMDDLSGNKRFTVVSITSTINTLEKLVGHPGSEQTKPLF